MAATRIVDFDTWRPGYDGASVEVLISGTTSLATIYSDAGGTVTLTNPQTLLSMTEVDGTAYGKFAQPVYVNVNYQLRVRSTETTGVQRIPLTTIAGANASLSVVQATRGAVTRTLADHTDVEVYAENFGVFSASAVANQAILDAAIGVAAAQGGGRVILPAGSWAFTDFSLPQDVVLEGRERGATTIRSSYTGPVCTIGGDGAGLRNLTLDGIGLYSNSIGVLGIGRDRITLDNVIIKRFAKGIVMRGGEIARFRETYVDNCATGADLRGDRDALLTNTGGPLLDLLWDGGAVTTCTTAGIRLSFEDDPVNRVEVRGVRFTENTGPAVQINGARDVLLHRCWWQDNTVNIEIDDDSDLSRVDENTVEQVTVQHSAFAAGELQFNGLCEDVRFDRCDFSDVDFVLSVPTFAIQLRDCTEDTACTASGTTSRLTRESTHKRGEFLGVTTDASWVTAWSYALDPGGVIEARIRFIGRQRNGVNWLAGEVKATFFRDGSSLAYGSGSGTPVAGTVVEGDTSGATARVTAVSGGTTGTLTVRDIEGEFINGEGLTFSDTKTATATAALTHAVAAINGTTTIAYGSASGTPVVGTFVTGGTSNAYARVIGVSGTSSGTLTISMVDGFFINGETLTFSDSKTATTTGNMVMGGWINIGGFTKTDPSWDVQGAVSGTSAQIQVKGGSSQTVEWLVEADVFRV